MELCSHKFFFFGGLGFEYKALHLLDRGSGTSVTPQAVLF
jgi:hypothetical protein